VSEEEEKQSTLEGWTQWSL